MKSPENHFDKSIGHEYTTYKGSARGSYNIGEHKTNISDCIDEAWPHTIYREIYDIMQFYEHNITEHKEALLNLLASENSLDPTIIQDFAELNGIDNFEDFEYIKELL